MDLEKQILIAKGTVKHLPIVGKFYNPKRTGGTDSSRYCYSVWMRHLVNLHRFCGRMPVRIAELGPGDSLGTGLAGLLSGCSNLFALDVVKYWDNERNLKIFDELITLFRNKTPIPDNNEFPKVRPHLKDYSFPTHIISDDALRENLADDRISVLKNEIEEIDNPSNRHVRYKIPWDDPGVIDKGTVDFIYSQAVLEAVEDLGMAYNAMGIWLKKGGYMSHTIDFKSHGLTKKWNGHWVFSDFEWYLVKGSRTFLINRQPVSAHIGLHLKHNFIILVRDLVSSVNDIDRDELAEKFRYLSEEDLTTSGVYLLSKKSI